MKPLSRLATLALPLRKRVAGTVALSCAATLSDVALLFTSGWLLAAAAEAGRGGIVTQNAFNMFLPAAAVRFFATVRILARYAERIATHDVALRLTGHIRSWSFSRLIPQMPALLHTQRSGDMMFRFAADTESLGQAFSEYLQPVITAILCLTVVTGAVAAFSIPAGVLLGSGLLLSGVLLPVAAGRATDATTARVTQMQETLRGDLTEIIQGLGEFRMLGAAERLQNRAIALENKINADQMRLAMSESAARAIMSFIAMAVALAILACGTSALRQGLLPAPYLPMLLLGTLAAFSVIAPLPAARQIMTRARAAGKNVFSLCDRTPDIAASGSAVRLPSHPDLILSNVSMKYPGRDEPVLHHAGLIIRSGERIALTGPSGTGKTSLINLLFRFCEYQEGSITFGGCDLRQIGTETMSQNISVVAQDFHIFVGSVRRNLLIACPDADEAQMWEALRIARLDDFVRAAPAGLDTLTGEAGIRLSGGQARRLAVAQAILRRTPWIILDEPTEGLDLITEAQLTTGLMNALPDDVTVICITHRPAVLPSVQRVLRLEHGQFHDVTSTSS